MLDTATGKDRRTSPRVEYFGVTVDADPAGRRVWPHELAQRLAVESFQSGLSVEAFAKEWELCPSVLSRWRMQAVKDGKQPKGRRTRPPGAREPAFAALVCDPTPAAAVTPSMTLELECGGVLARLPINTPVEQLRQVVAALRGST